MADNCLPSPATLRQLVAYNPLTGVLTWKQRDDAAPGWNEQNAGMPAFTSVHSKGYMIGKVHNRKYRAHRVIWAIAYGEWPKGEIDHINGVRTDNRLCNLRDVTSTENALNRAMRSNNRSGVVGVHWNRRSSKWIASINVQRRQIQLGAFDSIDAANNVRKAAESRYGYHPNHGRQAC